MTLEDKTDFSGKSQDEIAEARQELAKEAVNRIMRGILQSELIQFEVSETENHGIRATAKLGVYDIMEMDTVPEAPAEEKPKS